ncbi:Microtubule-associated protein 1A [Ancistrocladus abbreviatus]
MAGGGSEAAESTFSCARCGKPAHLQCPKCVELKLPREGAAFCSQDCFKESWSSHKSVHLKAKASSVETGVTNNKNAETTIDGWLYCMKKGQARVSKLPHFDWPGTLRPYPISSYRTVPAHIDKPDWALDGIPKVEPNSDLQHVVEIKNPEQIERMRETCRISREVLDAAARIVRPGVTTDEIDRVVHEATVAAGGYPSPLNYHFFPKSCCTSVNEVICHGIPDARKLEDGDIVNVDISVYYKGVHGDLNETYFVGNVDETSRKLVQCTYECLEKAISIGVWRDRMWPDGWTAVTADGKRSAQFEHTLLVTETGVEVLTGRLPTSPNVFPWLNV